MRLIDADELLTQWVERHQPNCHENVGAYYEWLQTYWAIKGAQTIELTRCDGCIYQRIGGNTTHYYWCDFWDREVDCNNYCSWGERKGGDTE